MIFSVIRFRRLYFILVGASVLATSFLLLSPVTLAQQETDESWDTFSKAETQFGKHQWAAAAELYHKGLAIDNKLKITRIDAARHYVKAARNAKNPVLIEEAVANLTKLRADADYLLSDPYYGVKKVHLTLVAPPGSLWNPNQPAVYNRIAQMFDTYKVDLVPHPVIGTDSGELMISVKTTNKGGRCVAEVLYEFSRLDPPGKPQMPNAPPPVKTGHSLVPQFIGAPADAEALINGQLEVFFDHIDDSRVE